MGGSWTVLGVLGVVCFGASCVTEVDPPAAGVDACASGRLVAEVRVDAGQPDWTEAVTLDSARDYGFCHVGGEWRTNSDKDYVGPSGYLESPSFEENWPGAEFPAMTLVGRIGPGAWRFPVLDGLVLRAHDNPGGVLELIANDRADGFSDNDGYILIKVRAL